MNMCINNPASNFNHPPIMENAQAQPNTLFNQTNLPTNNGSPFNSVMQSNETFGAALLVVISQIMQRERGNPNSTLGGGQPNQNAFPFGDGQPNQNAFPFGGGQPNQNAFPFGSGQPNQNPLSLAGKPQTPNVTPNTLDSEGFNPHISNQQASQLFETIITLLFQALIGGDTLGQGNLPTQNNQPRKKIGGSVNNTNNQVAQTMIVNGNNKGVINQQINKSELPLPVINNQPNVKPAFPNGIAGNFGANNRPAFNQQQPVFNEADQKAIDYVNSKKGHWLVSHADKIKQKDGDWGFKNGALKGYTAKHKGDGKFDIVNPDGKKIADYAAKKGNANKVASPIAFDLNQDGRISTTGQTTAKDRLANTQMGETRQFDINNDGKKETIEWVTGNGDALLTDEQGKLFGDEGGKYDNGYQKLALRDTNNDGQLTGSELKGLNLWIDNGDAVQTAVEMISVEDAGVSRISVNVALQTNERGEQLMRSDATINGQSIMSEDVWFGQN